MGKGRGRIAKLKCQEREYGGARKRPRERETRVLEAPEHLRVARHYKRQTRTVKKL
jgi:hypothetical protein